MLSDTGVYEPPQCGWYGTLVVLGGNGLLVKDLERPGGGLDRSAICNGITLGV